MSQCPEKLLRKQLSLPSKQLCFLESYYKHFGASPQFTNQASIFGYFFKLFT